MSRIYIYVLYICAGTYVCTHIHTCVRSRCGVPRADMCVHSRCGVPRADIYVFRGLKNWFQRRSWTIACRTNMGWNAPVTVRVVASLFVSWGTVNTQVLLVTALVWGVDSNRGSGRGDDAASNEQKCHGRIATGAIDCIFIRQASSQERP